MSSALRPYQERATLAVRAAWQSTRRVLLVAPTGSGKTRMALSLLPAQGRVLWLAHRRELVTQAADVIRSALGRFEVGVLQAGAAAQPHARIQVASLQTLLARGAIRPPADVVVCDEAHHHVADEWRTIVDAYPAARVLGLTATPERSDGRALGDVFESLVVAASYSELVRDGYLVPCRVFRPASPLESDLAQDPVTAYERHAVGPSGLGQTSVGAQCFAFTHSIAAGRELALQFTARGFPAAAVSAESSGGERDQSIRRFSAGELRVLISVYALTEGVDVPEASVCLLARGVGSTGAYLQMVGRVLRPAPGKATAVLIDLSGASYEHGLPTEDREYALAGRAISASVGSLRCCPECGATFPSGTGVCPVCSHLFTPGKRDITIHDLELREVYAGAETPVDAKATEWNRLLAKARAKEWSVGWAIGQYRRLFQELPPMDSITPLEKRLELERLHMKAIEKGYRSGWAAVRYKEMFGTWPPRRAA